MLTTQVANGFVLKQLHPGLLPGRQRVARLRDLPRVDEPRLRPPSRAAAAAVAPVRICGGPVRDAPGRELRGVRPASASSSSTSPPTTRPTSCCSPSCSPPSSCRSSRRAAPGLAARELAEFTPRYLELFTRLAIKYNVNIVGGSHFTVEGDTLYNIAYLFRRDGTIGKQYKLHITPNERRWWGVSPGDALEVFDTDRGKIAILICYDVEFPELARIAADKGAQILFVPFNTDSRYGYLRVRTARRRAASRTTSTRPSRAASATCPSSRTPTSTTPSRASSRPPTSRSRATASPRSARPTSRRCLIHDVDLELLRRHRQTRHRPELERPAQRPLRGHLPEDGDERVVGVRGPRPLVIGPNG